MVRQPTPLQLPGKDCPHWPVELILVLLRPIVSRSGRHVGCPLQGCRFLQAVRRWSVAVPKEVVGSAAAWGNRRTT